MEIALIAWPPLPITIFFWLSRATKMVCSILTEPSFCSFQDSVTTADA